MLPFIMLATYLTIYVVLPFYLKKRKLFLTVVCLFALLFLATLGERFLLKKINNLPITFDSLFGVTFLYFFLETNFVVAIAFAIKIVKKLFEQQNEKYEMEKQNLETELNLLKAQLQPHFLFNTMNNLYALSIEKSTKTSDGIAKISALLRSVLYECNEVEIELEKEISLIENYIDLERMRYAEKLQVDFKVSGTPADNKIAPMLLFTFVENCFKHGGFINSETSYIKIELKIKPQFLLFCTENSKSNKGNENQKNKSSGIGLKNVKKRLEIIYPGNHDLKITDTKNKFTVGLQINRQHE